MHEPDEEDDTQGEELTVQSPKPSEYNISTPKKMTMMFAVDLIAR